MNEAPRTEWVDLSEAFETASKVLFILVVAAFFLFMLFDYYLTDAVNIQTAREGTRNTRLLQEASAIRNKIEYLKGRIETLDPVFDWWFSTMYGRMEAKRQRAFMNMDFMLRYVGI